MTKSAPWFVAVMLVSISAFAGTARVNNAQDKDVLPNTYLRGKHVINSHPAPGGLHGAQKFGNAASFSTNGANATTACPPESFALPCLDTIINFTGQFKTEGVYLDGTARDTWQYSMVGRGPGNNVTTTLGAPVIPVTIDMLNADGTPRSVVTNTTNCPKCTTGELGKTVRLLYSPANLVNRFMGSPVFQNATYPGESDATQIADAEQRAEFGSRAGPNWHTLLAPSSKPGLTMALIEGTYFFALNNNGTCCAFVLVSDPVFSNELFPQTAPPDNSTVIGTAEVSGEITTKDISTFLFPNTYLYENNNPNDCCVLGFHGIDTEPGDASNGNRARFYVINYSSWISPGLFIAAGKQTCPSDQRDCIQDVTAHSHEMAETFNDPFVGYDGIHNITPFWLNPAGQCQDIMEVGDVIEDLPNPVFPITINGFTYHPQTVAILPWFEFQSPSTALSNAYSYPGVTALTSLSAPQPFNCNGQ